MAPIATTVAALRPRVHVLGLGSIGTFAAHSISTIPSGPSVVLLLHRKSLLEKHRLNGNKIRFESREGKRSASRGYELEMLSNDKWYNIPQELEPQHQDEAGANPAQDTITNLIVCVKATQTVTAIRSLTSRLNRDSNILFLQNGAGMIDEVNRHLFPDPISRPNYLIGVISHGVTLNEPFDITHTGFSATSIGPVPRDHTKVEDIPVSQSKYLLDVLPQSQILNAISYRYIDILQIQLEKLAVNAFCNPICALNDAKNEFLFTVPKMRRNLLEEISQVVLAFPELKGVPGVQERFSVERLESTVNMIIQKTSQTTCSMVWDLRAGRETEVKFINGFWSRMGRMTGVKTPVNDDLVCQILAKSARKGNQEIEFDHK